MGQIPAKYFPPPTPYGVSPNVGAIGAPTQVDTTTVGSAPSPAVGGSGGAPQYQGGPTIQPPTQATTDQIKKPLTGGSGTS